MRKLVLIGLIAASSAQASVLDSLYHQMEQTTGGIEKLDFHAAIVKESTLVAPASAEERARQYLSFAKQVGDNWHIAHAHYLLGVIYHLRTKFDVSMNELLTALRMFEKQKNEEFVAKTQATIGTLYQVIGELEKSGRYLRQGLAYYSKKDDPNRIADLTYNLGNLKTEMYQFDSALYYYHIVERMFNRLDDKIGMARVNLSLGSVMAMDGDVELGMIYARRSVRLTRELDDMLGLQASLASLGQIYLDHQELDSAKRYLLEAHTLKDVVGNQDMTGDICKLLSQVYEQQDSSALSIHYLKSYLTNVDSAYNPKALHGLSEAVKRFEMEKKDLEVKAKDVEVENRTYQLTIAILVGLCSIILLLALVIRSRMRQRLHRERLKSKDLEQKELRLLLGQKDREIVTHALFLAKRDQLIENVNDKLESLGSRLEGDAGKEVKDLLQELQLAGKEKSWEAFEKRFLEVHPEFYENLNNTFPFLTRNERRLCAFLKLNMSTKDISEITLQSTRAIEVARHRLRKKLELERDENLIAVISNL